MLFRKMRPKKILAITAVILYGLVLQMTTSEFVRRAAAVVILNALLCHVGGCIEWDIVCNAVLVALVTASSRWRHHRKACAASCALWMMNHYLVDSALVHVLGVQAVGAVCLLQM
jgi:4-amino-4-deoxy-L-arabinose transferase-like glycosyltransferase